MAETPLWVPSRDRIEHAGITAFRREAEARCGRPLPDYASLHRYSVEHLESFWRLLWEFCGVVGDPGTRVVVEADAMPGARFFPDARLNFAQNVLRHPDDRPAILFWGESRVRRSLTRAELTTAVASCAHGLRAAGVAPGDRVAAYLPNLPETVIAALATASLGAIWSSCSPDFGVQGVLDRFGQIRPKVLFSADGYYYGGREHDTLTRLAAVLEGLPSVEQTVVVPYVGDDPDLRVLTGARLWDDFCHADAGAPRFEPLPFNHPLYILYSSGTTGVPKCIVHGAGGTLLQHLKEHQLHCDIRPGDRVFYYTTSSWMMWNWLVTALASEATILLYDGSPFYPDGRVLFDMADAMGTTLFGTSAKFLASVEKAGLTPDQTHRLQSVRTITSTGSPLSPASFDFVYRHVKADVHLCSMSGGTDIISCFVGGDPAGPVWRGEIQAPVLGMDVDILDERGQPVRGEPGELVCRRPFPSMPLEFWDDASGEKYRSAYFTKYPGLWCHGDWVAFTEHGGLVIYGRSDAVLNPGGVRIGTSEIYRVVEGLDEVLEALVVGQRWEDDERVVLFVRLQEGARLDETLVARIRDEIRRHTTPRHVPARIVQVRDIPRTKSGKIVELAVRDVIHGRSVKHRESLANPEALEEFRDRPELEH
jgi:acetoacetyl-CoA synthetase